MRQLFCRFGFYTLQLFASNARASSQLNLVNERVVTKALGREVCVVGG